MAFLADDDELLRETNAGDDGDDDVDPLCAPSGRFRSHKNWL